MIKYKNVEEIYEAVKEDLSTYDLRGQIDTSSLIPVIRKCNKELGYKINKTREEVLDVKNFKARLPEDFELLNFGVLCKLIKKGDCLPSGFNVEVSTKNCGSCVKSIADPNSEQLIIFQKLNNTFTFYEDFDLVTVTQNSYKHCNENCFNFNSRSKSEIEIKNGWAYTNFQEGKLYINYVSDMLDEDGNILVIDNPIVDDFYKNACILKILKNLLYNKEEDVSQLYMLAKKEFEESRRQALLISNMPEYYDLEQVAKYNRSRFYDKYVRYFKIW